MKELTIKQAIEALPHEAADEWVQTMIDELSGLNFDEEDTRSLKRGFWWALRTALEKIAPVTIVHDPEENNI